jgi:DNA primase
LADAIGVAHLVREALVGLGMRWYVSRGLEAKYRGVTTEWLKKKRRSVLVDDRQNGRGRATAAVCSVCPKPGAPVSTPLRWEELVRTCAAATSACATHASTQGSLAAADHVIYD